MAPKKSVAWDHFTDKGDFKAECKMCKAVFSYKSGVTNLTKHIQRKHLAVNLVRRDNNLNQLENQPIQEAQMNAPPMSQTTATGISSQTATTSSMVRSHPSSISAFLRRDCNKIKKEIDDHLMNLFVCDMQPFSIVEDKGFRELIKFAFPNYTIPSRKYFANNLLPGLYEEVKTATKISVSEDASSICLTTDIWTSRNNDSYLAITGHYIDRNYNLQSVLLECKVLEKSHTGVHLAEEIKNVTQDWSIPSEKVLLVVSDNGANITNAVKQILGWKHFSCYAHTLNLAVQKILGNSYIKDTLSKVKSIVSYFKRSNVAWNKLKTYQEQANKVVKRPLQDVPTRWNSTFYMLSRFVELKDEINCAMSNLDVVNCTRLTSYDWDVCQSLIWVLRPCEEVTREMSGQKYVSGSSVIPITVGLTNALQEIATETYRQENNISIFPDEVEMCRQDLLSEINSRFQNLERSRTLTISTFLDPRYKLYFQNATVAENTKHHVVGLVTSMIQQTETNQPTTTGSEAPQDVQEKKSNSLIWQHYIKTMKNVRPTGTANSRAIIEVQKYIDDSVLSPDMDPLTWWRANQSIYPNLAKLAKLKLNAMATSVPCERLFSVAGNILTERRSRLGSRKVQQLIFLQQNKKH
ncbi:zinc finger BED domain-containing protein 4-like [Spodoptera litura]|uniref:Zinc finger BED domain-containing protein 4-like n=1 Tax=Spodoptera litura TaxID=69820 RepID=A0A9J7ECS1_SPOLT|nr:zinc finger BED domain-containing protein 4-like [Spodoptera litura]